MKRIVAWIVVFLMMTSTVHAQIGDNGFELGISSGRFTTTAKKAATQTYPYSEVVLVTGEPLIFSGTVAITKREKGDVETLSYKYTLTNGVKNKLTRTCVYDAQLSKSDTQCIRKISTNNGTKPRETIIADGVTYTLDSANSIFSLSTISDLRPAVDYYAGNWSSDKTYTTKDGKAITVKLSSEMYGYDQHWSSTEVQEVQVYLSGITQNNDIYDQWGGNGRIKITQTTTNTLSYIENKPDAISFSGGYLRKQDNDSVLEYDFDIPIFDAKGISSDTIENYRDTVRLSASPEQERLNVADTSAISGYWYEEQVKQLAGLGVLKDEYLTNYKKLDESMSRKDFAVAIAKAVKLELIDLPVPNKKTGYVEKPFTDVDITDEAYPYIYTLYKNGVMFGTGQNMFSPNQPANRAQAVLIIIRMLGLDSLADANRITQFKDNDEIPPWAKSAVLAGVRIGMVKGDDNNQFNPNTALTVAQTSSLVYNLIEYMRNGMLNDFREKTLYLYE